MYNYTMNTSVYIMTHKKCPLPSDNIYKPLHVGHALSEDLGMPGDDTGDNISELNPLFGELTGMYWVWKNDDSSDIIGICHYRRFFMDNDNNLLSDSSIRQLLGQYDIIASPHAGGDVTSYESYAAAHNIADYDALGRALHDLYPEYDPSFEWYRNSKGGYFANLAIMPKSLYDSYCEWMFSVLFEASEHIDVSGYDLYHRRVYGFLSEILMNVWIHHNSVNVYECPVMFTSEKAETTELKKAIAGLVRESRIKEARALYYDITRIRPDVLLPESDISGELLIIEQILYILDEEENRQITGLKNVSDDLFKILMYYKEQAPLIKQAFEDNEENPVEYALPESISPIAVDVITRLYK